jgi:chemotaxis protein MotB
MLQSLVPYAGQYAFGVEGHTDSTPVLTGALYASNWELSSARANAVRSRLEGVGVEQRRIRVEGYADTVALPEESLTGLSADERLARHRRVVVRIY